MKPISIKINHHHCTPYPKGQHGLTLIEVMIAITISLILLTGVMQIFTGSRQTYRVQDNMARLQENGRFAIDFLTRDLRMAGYTGCASKSATVNVIATNPAASFTNNGLTGYEYANLPITNLTTAEVQPDTDIVVIKKASSSGVTLMGNMTSVNANIQVPTATAAGLFTAGDILFISDCTSADIFVATSVSNGSGTTTIAHASSTNTSNNLSKAYGTDSEVMIMENHVYYIGTDATNNNAPTLYRRRVGITIDTQPLVGGVENMQILYGEDTDAPTTPDGSANRYVAANTAGLDMSRVVSVRLNLLLRTQENHLATSAQPYTLNGVTVTPTDRYLRRVFSTTIKVRNKGL